MMSGICEDLNNLVNNLKSGDSDTWFMTAITVLNIYVIYYMVASPC